MSVAKLQAAPYFTNIHLLVSIENADLQWKKNIKKAVVFWKKLFYDKTLHSCITEKGDFFFFNGLMLFWHTQKKCYSKFYPGYRCLESQTGLSPSHLINNN